MSWLGLLPSGWNAKRLKYVSSINDEALPETTDPDYELLYVDIGSVEATKGIQQKEPLFFESAPSRARRIVRDGDTIVSTVRTYLKAIAPIQQPEDNLIVSTGFAVIRPKGIESKFLSYCLRSSYFIETVVSRSVGVSYPATNPTDASCIEVPLPPIEEQQTIADFLDAQTAKIDSLLTKKRQLIDTLKEERSALIARTVTRGLPPDAAQAAGLEPHPAMKDSGVECMRQIPKHWKVLPLTKYLAEMSDYRGKTPEKMDEGVFLVTARNVRMGFIDYDCSQEYVAEGDYIEIMRRGLPKHGDILFTTEAPLGNVALVNREDIALAQRIMRFRMNPRFFDSRFTLFGMMADYFQFQLSSLSTGSTAEGLKSSKLHMLQLVAPPLEEQQTIAAYLDCETARIDQLTAKVEIAVERLTEYRQALITSAVTGKIDVREIAP